MVETLGSSNWSITSNNADNDTQFTGRLFKAEIDEAGAKLVNTPLLSSEQWSFRKRYNS
jgi:hypothetical protein